MHNSLAAYYAHRFAQIHKEYGIKLDDLGAEIFDDIMSRQPKGTELEELLELKDGISRIHRAVTNIYQKVITEVK